MKGALPAGALAVVTLCGMAVLPVSLPGPARADREEARKLRERGEILSLELILERARKRFPGGRLVEAELEREDGRLVYEVELIDADGVFRELFFDARSGEPIPELDEEEH